MKNGASTIALSIPLVLLAACAPEPGSERPPRPVQVQRYGALRAMFHEGRVGAEVRLDELLPDPYLYGVGALSELRGEVTIVAGESFLSYPTDVATSRTERHAESTEEACLLVTASVLEWVEQPLAGEVPFDGFDRAIEQAASSAGLEPSESFPFLIEGPVRDLRWHVIDGKRLTDGGSTHTDHLGASVGHALAEGSATLVGFHSTTDHGVFTHMGSNAHVHAMVSEPLSSGHVDHVILPAGTIVLLPRARAD